MATDDFEYARWKRKHPKFPGASACIELLHRRNVRGATIDFICGELRDNAADHSLELIEAAKTEPDARVRCILFGILYEAALPESLPVFVKNLRSNNEGVRCWAEKGLRRLDTPEARRALWQAGLR